MEDASMTSENVSGSEAVEPVEAVQAKAVDDQLIEELLGRAQAEGLQLTGEGGLLQQLTKRLMESALEVEITDYLGYDKQCACGAGQLRNRQTTDAWRVPQLRLAGAGVCRPQDQQGPTSRSNLYADGPTAACAPGPNRSDPGAVRVQLGPTRTGRVSRTAPGAAVPCLPRPGRSRGPRTAR